MPKNGFLKVQTCPENTSAYNLESSQSLFLLINMNAGPSELGCNPFAQILTEISAKFILNLRGPTKRFEIGWTSQYGGHNVPPK